MSAPSAAASLASVEASYADGTLLVVDGGICLQDRKVQLI